MATLVLKVMFWGLFATVLACVEIEAEGKHGWAEKMPTWYRTRGFIARVYGLMMGGKPLTGYHAFMFFMPALIFHTHFFLGVEWTIAGELAAWALYFAWCPLWDYFWFVLNPHYQGKFKKTHVWWHAQSPWILGLFPLDYLMGILISIGFAAGAMFVSGSTDALIGHLKLLGGLAIYTICLHIAAPLYRKWYSRMRMQDDRESAKIFHKD